MRCTVHLAAIVGGLWLTSHVPAFAQGNNNNNNNAGGIRIDAAGVVTMALEHDRGGQLDKKRKAALARQTLPGDISHPSELRTVSLVRLEAACAELLAGGKPLPVELACLAGLTRLDHIFVDVDEKDLLIAGPAEPFVQADSGRRLGLESGRPVLLLDDLVVALRTVAVRQVVGCSIDPVAERLAKLQVFLKQNNSPTTPAVIQQRFRRMQEILGRHDVSVMGVPDDSHFARGLVEADIRMKVLALGLEDPGVKGFRSHLSMAGTGNSLQRWWFVPLYDHISRSEDGLSYEFAGQRAQLLGEDELANAHGERSKAALQKVSTEAFSRQFTEKFPDLAANMPVFAKLQQLIDWTVFTALVKQEQLAEKIDWSMPVFSNADKLPHDVWPVPKQTNCLVNTKRTNTGVVVGQLSGGVVLRPEEILRQITPRGEESAAQTKRRANALDRSQAKDHPWWWD